MRLNLLIYNLLIKKGLLHLDAEGIFFDPKLYVDTARGRKND